MSSNIFHCILKTVTMKTIRQNSRRGGQEIQEDQEDQNNHQLFILTTNSTFSTTTYLNM